MKKKSILLLLAISFIGNGVVEAQKNKATKKTVAKKQVQTSFTNPVMWADVPDM